MYGPWVMGIILLGLGIFVCSHAVELTLGKPSRPGPGFLPFGLGLILVFLAILYLVQSRRQKPRSPAHSPGSFLRTLLAVGILCFFAAFVNWLGYLITTFFLFVFWLVLIERKKWPMVFFLACLAMVAVYFFNFLFSVQLPRGLLRGI
jgi:hypothetical protein